MEDFYKRIDQFESELQSAGFADWAKKLNNVVAGSTSGTEILMGLRWNFKELLKTENLPDSLRQQSEELITEIRALLKDNQ